MTGAAVHSSPTVVNGIVYVGSEDKNLYAIDAQTGTKKWTFSSEGSIFSSPSVAKGVVYVGCYNGTGKIYAIDAQTGLEKWSFTAGNWIRSSPTILNDIIYVGSEDSNLYAINAQTGIEKWRFETDYYVRSSPCVVGSDGKTVHSSVSGTENENISKNILRPNPENIVLTSVAQKSQTLLTSNNNWTAKSNADWLVLENTNGTAGTANVIFSLSANLGQKRSATITFTAGDLTWLAFVEQSPGIYISVDSRLIDGKEQTYNDLLLNSLGTWTATTSATWLNISPVSGNTATNQAITLQATTNNSGTTRTAEVVFTSNGISQTFKLTQQQAGVPIANMLYIGSLDGNLYAIDAQTGAKKWNFKAGSSIISSPTVTNGIVYVGCGDNNFYAIDIQTGTKKWTFSTGSAIESSPTVANGIVYVGSDDGNLYALDAQTGTKKWNFKTGSGISSSPIVANSIVYVGSRDSNIYALDTQTGAKKWSFKTGYYVDSSPTVVNGIVYVGSWDNNVYALDAQTGTKKWNFETRGQIYNSSPTVLNGIVYVGSLDSNVYALDAQTGTKKWNFKTGSGISSSPIVANGIVYVGSRDSNIYALDTQTGAKKWSFATGSYVDSSPTVLNGIVYVGSWDNNVYALDAQTGTKKWNFETGGPIYNSSPCVVGSDDKSYHSSVSGYDDANPTLLLEKTIDNISGNAQTINNSIAASAAWAATTDATWLKINVPNGSATPNQAITFIVEANSGIKRTAVVTFKADGLTKTLSIIQGAIPSLSISPNNQTVAYTASTATTTINTNYDWTSSADVTWLKVNPASGAAANDKQNISISVEANTSTIANRTGKITFSAGGLTQVLTITQDFTPVITLSANSQSVSGAAGNTALTLNTNNAWTATSDAAWAKLNLSSGTAGTNQVLSISLDANPSLSAARTAKITFSSGGLTQVFTVIQSYTPLLTLAPSMQTVPYSAGNATANLTANFAWTAVSDATWLKLPVSSGDSTKNKSVLISVEANTSTTATRTGKITFSAGGLTQVFTITQDFTPVLTLSANSQSVSGAAGNTALTLNTNNAWTATSDAAWAKLNISSGTSGMNQALNISLDANPSLSTARTTKITFSSGGLTQVFTVTQSYTPVLTLGANSKNVGFAAGTTSTTITANHAWTASSDATWLKVSPAAGDSTRNFNISMTFEANTSTTATRTGKVTFSAGGLTQVFTITQDFTPVLTLAANSQAIAGTATAATAILTANKAWTASSDATWLKAPASGVAGNNQNVALTTEVNQSIAARTAKVTFSSDGLTQVFTVNQAFAAYLTLSANAQNVSNEVSTQSISLNTNSAWAVTSDATWLKTSLASGNAGTNQNISISAEANTGSATRVGTLTFKAGDVTQTYVLTQAALLGNEADILESVSVYPNPTASLVNLGIDSPSEQAMHLQLLNGSGQRISVSEYQLQAGKQTVQVSVSDVPAGQYFIHLNFENGKKATKKVMVLK